MQKASGKNESDLKEKHNQFESELQIQRCLLDLSKKSKVCPNTFDKMMYKRPEEMSSA
jgi:hypothetical protein